MEYWSGLPYPPPGHLPDPGIEPVFLILLHWQMDSLPLAPPGKHDKNHDLNKIKFSIYGFFSQLWLLFLRFPENRHFFWGGGGGYELA